MTSISELSNPQPSTGFPDFPTLRSHGSHSEGSSLGRLQCEPPNVASPGRELDRQLPCLCGAFAQNWQQQYTEGMPLFICRQVTKSERGTLTGRHVTHNILASVPVINFYLTLGSCDQQFVKSFVKKYALNDALIPSADPAARTMQKKIKVSLMISTKNGLLWASS